MADQPGSANLSQLSRLMAWFSTLGAVVVPLAVTATFLFPPTSGALGFRFDNLTAAQIAQAPLGFRTVALVCALASTGFSVWALWSLRRLFLLYAGREVFSHHALRMLNYVAVALFASVVVGFVMQAPITLLLSWNLGAGHRAISLGLNNHDIGALFLSGTVLVIARVMAEARRMADENESFV